MVLLAAAEPLRPGRRRGVSSATRRALPPPRTQPSSSSSAASASAVVGAHSGLLWVVEAPLGRVVNGGGGGAERACRPRGRRRFADGRLRVPVAIGSSGGPRADSCRQSARAAEGTAGRRPGRCGARRPDGGRGVGALEGRRQHLHGRGRTWGGVALIGSAKPAVLRRSTPSGTVETRLVQRPVSRPSAWIRRATWRWSQSEPAVRRRRGEAHRDIGRRDRKHRHSCRLRGHRRGG